MLTNSLAIPISNDSKKKYPDSTCSFPKTTKMMRIQHKAGSGSTRDTLRALLDTGNRAEARISKAREAVGGDGSTRATRKILDSIRRIATGEEGVPSVSQTALRVPTIENNLEASADHVQQAIRENRPRTFWGTPPRNSPPPSITSPSSDQVRFRQGLDDAIQNGMSKISIEPPPHFL